MNEYIRATYMNKYHEVENIYQLLMSVESHMPNASSTSHQFLIQYVEVVRMIQENKMDTIAHFNEITS